MRFWIENNNGYEFESFKTEGNIFEYNESDHFDAMKIAFFKGYAEADSQCYLITEDGFIYEITNPLISQDWARIREAESRYIDQIEAERRAA